MRKRVADVVQGQEPKQRQVRIGHPAIFFLEAFFFFEN
jgi:hypothetical protein